MKKRKKYNPENQRGTQKWRFGSDNFPFQTGDFQVPCQFLQDTSRSFHKSPPLSPFYHIIIYTIVWQTSFYHIATLLHAKRKSLYILEIPQKQDTNTRKQWNPTHDNDQKQNHYDYDNTICDHNSYIRMFPHFKIFFPQKSIRRAPVTKAPTLVPARPSSSMRDASDPGGFWWGKPTCLVFSISTNNLFMSIFFLGGKKCIWNAISKIPVFEKSSVFMILKEGITER